MAANVLVDASFLVALLYRRDVSHAWAVAQSARLLPPWKTCEAVLSEASYLLGTPGRPTLTALLRRRTVTCPFALTDNTGETLDLMDKYADVPMSLADACLVRMTETFADPVLLTADRDFHIYRRHGRQAIPCAMPD